MASHSFILSKFSLSGPPRGRRGVGHLLSSALPPTSTRLLLLLILSSQRLGTSLLPNLFPPHFQFKWKLPCPSPHCVPPHHPLLTPVFSQLLCCNCHGGLVDLNYCYCVVLSFASSRENSVTHVGQAPHVCQIDV